MKLNKLKQCAFGVLIVISVLLAVCTMVEKIYGTEWVLANMYKSWWFVVLWGILAVSTFIYICRRKLYKQKTVFLLHAAFGFILMGALVTYLTSERGYIHLRQGETYRSYTDEADESERPLPFQVKLVLFDMEYHEGTDEPADYISFLKIDEEICKVSMNKIVSEQQYRIYQMAYDPDEMGSTLLITHDPWGIGITYAGYILLGISMLWLLGMRMGWRGLLYTAIPVSGLWYYISQINPMTPILRSPMLAAHVSVIMVAYALFIAITVISIVGLSSKRSEKMYRWNSLLLYPALFLLTAGIFIGAVWANISWGRYWGWDAKETWALITLFVYAFPMHKQSLPMFRTPRRFHIYCVVALLTVVMTFVGVTYFLGGIHSYV